MVSAEATGDLRAERERVFTLECGSALLCRFGLAVAFCVFAAPGCEHRGRKRRNKSGRAKHCRSPETKQRNKSGHPERSRVLPALAGPPYLCPSGLSSWRNGRAASSVRASIRCPRGIRASRKRRSLFRFDGAFLLRFAASARTQRRNQTRRKPAGEAPLTGGLTPRRSPSPFSHAVIGRPAHARSTLRSGSAGCVCARSARSDSARWPPLQAARAFALPS
jgi:hypothetical protein